MSLGTISGQVKLDVAQAIAGFAAIRTASAASSGNLAAAGSKVSLFGKLALGAGVALVAAFGASINAAATFEKKMDYFGAVNNATAADMEKVRAKALQLGRDGQFSAGQIADAFVEMGKAGVSVSQITGGLADAVVNLASAADINLTDATNILTAQMAAYNLKASDAKHVTDVLAGAANASIVDVSDLGVSLKYVGGVANSLGIGFDSTVTALSLLGKAGIKGSTAGTSLRQMMVSLSGSTNKAKGELEDLGIITNNGTSNAFFDAHGKAKSLAEIFQILQDHTRGLTQEQQLMAFKTIFNNRALSAAEILTKAGAKGFSDMSAQMAKTTAADVASKRLNNLAGDMQRLRGSIDTLMIQAGTPFQGMLRGIVQAVNAIVNAFINMPSGVQTAILAFIGVTGVILTFLGAVALVGGTILKAVSVFKEMAGAFKLLTGITKTLTIATWEQTVAALSNPYVLIAMAVIALIVAMIVLYNKSETFRKIMDAIGSGIKRGFLATVDWFKTLPKFFEGLWKTISNWFGIGVGWVKQNWDILLFLFTGPLGLIVLVVRRFGTTIVNFFKSVPGAITSALSTAWSAFTGFVMKLPYYIGYALGYVLGTIVKWGINMVNLTYSVGSATFHAIIYFFTKLPIQIAGYFVALYNWVMKWTITFIKAAGKFSVDAFNAMVDWFKKLPGRIATFFTSLYHNSLKAFNEFNTAAGNFAIAVYNAVVNWFAKLPGRIWDFLVSMKDKAVSAFNTMVSFASSFGSKLYHGFIDQVTALPGMVGSILNNCIDAFKNVVTQAYDAAKQFAGGLWNGFKKGLGINSPSLIEKQMWQITDVTQTETTKLAAHVGVMQRLAGQLSTNNPAIAASTSTTSTIAQMTKDMVVQNKALQNAATALFPLGTSAGAASSSATNGGASATSATGLTAGQSQPAIQVTVNNPVAEQASDSIARKLRTLTAMGAF